MPRPTRLSNMNFLTEAVQKFLASAEKRGRAQSIRSSNRTEKVSDNIPEASKSATHGITNVIARRNIRRSITDDRCVECGFIDPPKSRCKGKLVNCIACDSCSYWYHVCCVNEKIADTFVCVRCKQRR
jgi:hypothetical protein